MEVSHKAFLDLEDSLTAKISSNLSKKIKQAEAALGAAVADQDSDAAFEAIDSIDTASAAEDTSRAAETLAIAALLLGASRFGLASETNVNSTIPRDLIESAVAQHSLVVEEAPKKALKTSALAVITTSALAAVSGKAAPSLETQVSAILSGAKNASRVSASLFISRLASLGFLLEADSRDVELYMVNEVLDSLICPVCAVMHGKIFSVGEGLNHVQSVLSARDPSTVQGLAPWPSQSSESVGQLSNLNSDQLSDRGLSLPPYHPMCRGIVVPIDTDLEPQQERIAPGMVSDFSGNLTSLLFGEEPDVIPGTRN